MFWTNFFKDTTDTFPMPKRKVSIVIDFDDDKINNIEDLEGEILKQDIYGQIAKKYLESLQNEVAQKTPRRKGSKKVHIKTPHFEFDFQAKRAINEDGKKSS